MNGRGPKIARHSEHAQSGRSPWPWTPTTTGRGSRAPIGAEMNPSAPGSGSSQSAACSG